MSFQLPTYLFTFFKFVFKQIAGKIHLFLSCLSWDPLSLSGSHSTPILTIERTPVLLRVVMQLKRCISGTPQQLPVMTGLNSGQFNVSRNFHKISEEGGRSSSSPSSSLLPRKQKWWRDLKQSSRTGRGCADHDRVTREKITTLMTLELPHEPWSAFPWLVHDREGNFYHWTTHC